MFTYKCKKTGKGWEIEKNFCLKSSVPFCPVSLDKQGDALFQDFHLGLQVVFVLEHGVVDAGADKDKDQGVMTVYGIPMASSKRLA